LDPWSPPHRKQAIIFLGSEQQDCIIDFDRLMDFPGFENDDDLKDEKSPWL